MCRFETTGVQLAQSSVCPSRSCQTKLRKIKIRKKRVAPPPRGPTRLGGAAAEMRGDPVASYCRRRRDARAEIVLPLPSVKRPRCNFRAASVQNVRATCTGSAGTLIFRNASIPREVPRIRSSACPMRTRTACNHWPAFVRSLRLRIYESYYQCGYAMARTLGPDVDFRKFGRK